MENKFININFTKIMIFKIYKDDLSNTISTILTMNY